MPITLDVALGLRDRLQVYGTNYPTPDGMAVRDYIHVLDLALAHIKAIEFLSESGRERRAQSRTGAGRSVLEVVREAKLVTGRAIPTAWARRSGDAASLVADPSLARQRLGWSTTEYSALSTILADAWRWHQKRFSMNRRDM